MDMTYHEMLTILELKEGFTEEELKKNYRRLAMQYHPDQWNMASEAEQNFAHQKTQKINWAHAELLKSLKNGGYMDKNSVAYEKSRYQAVLRNLIEDPKAIEKNYPDYYDQYVEEIRELINKFSKNVISLYNRVDIKCLYNVTERNIIEKYISLCEKYCSDCKLKFECKGNIFVVEGIQISYECPIRTLFEQLECAKNKVLEKHILSIIERYRDNANFRILKTTIDQLIKETIEDYNQQQYGINLIKAFLDGKIKELFEQYDYFKSNVEIMNQFLIEADDTEEVKAFRAELQKYQDILGCGKLPNKEEFDTFVSNVENFKRNYDNCKRLQTISYIMDTVMSNFNKVMMEARTNVDTNCLVQASAIFSKLMELMERIKKGTINLEIATLLLEVTFTDYIKDINILESVSNNVLLINHSNIYVKRGHDMPYQKVFRTLALNEGKYYLDGVNILNEIFREEVNLNQLMTDYISLDSLLETTPYIGKTHFYKKELVVVLYKWNGNALVVNEAGNLEIRDEENIGIELHEHRKEEFEDKNLIKSMASGILNIEKSEVRV